MASVQANTAGSDGNGGMLLSLDQMASTFWSESAAGGLCSTAFDTPLDYTVNWTITVSTLCSVVLNEVMHAFCKLPWSHIQMARMLWCLRISNAGSAMVQQLSEPFDPASSHPAALEKRRFALSPLQAITLTTRRQMKLVLRDKVLLKGRMLQVGWRCATTLQLTVCRSCAGVCMQPSAAQTVLAVCCFYATL